jgi:breast cancer 2 susceptibility protein
MPLLTHAEVGAQSVCPPREVRSFRVLLMRDARSARRPARRVVELTVWDVLSLSFDEAPVGQFKEGQRFHVRFNFAR